MPKRRPMPAPSLNFRSNTTQARQQPEMVYPVTTVIACPFRAGARCKAEQNARCQRTVRVHAQHPHGVVGAVQRAADSQVGLGGFDILADARMDQPRRCALSSQRASRLRLRAPIQRSHAVFTGALSPLPFRTASRRVASRESSVGGAVRRGLHCRRQLSDSPSMLHRYGKPAPFAPSVGVTPHYPHQPCNAVRPRLHALAPHLHF